jgi:predicted RNA polymerase sigma factor
MEPAWPAGPSSTSPGPSFLHRAGGTREAIAAFLEALALPLPKPERAFLQRRIAELAASQR